MPPEPPAEPKIANWPQDVDRHQAARRSPRAVAPEKTIDLSAMRELANLSAKAAIEHHALGKLARTSGSKLFVAAVAVVSGGLLLWMGSLLKAGILAVNAGIVAMVIAIAWIAQCAVLVGRRRGSTSGGQGAGAKRAFGKNVPSDPKSETSPQDSPDSLPS